MGSSAKFNPKTDSNSGFASVHEGREIRVIPIKFNGVVSRKTIALIGNVTVHVAVDKFFGK
jgi:hypothetical protein